MTQFWTFFASHHRHDFLLRPMYCCHKIIEPHPYDRKVIYGRTLAKSAEATKYENDCERSFKIDSAKISGNSDKLGLPIRPRKARLF
jgi:hypothetical protein